MRLSKKEMDALLAAGARVIGTSTPDKGPPVAKTKVAASKHVNGTKAPRPKVFNPGAAVFAAGDKIQLEVYVQTTAAGVPTPPAVATDLWLTINETDANSGAKVSPQTYAINYARSLTASAVGVMGTDLNTDGRQATLFRTLAATMIGVTPTFVRAVTKTLAATMTGVTPELIKSVGKTLETTMVGVAALIKKAKIIVPTVTMTGVATLARQASLFRTLAVSMVGSPTLNRALTLRRTLEAAMTGVVTAFVKIPFAKVPTGGGTTIFGMSRGRVVNP